MSDNFTTRTSWLTGELAEAVGVGTDTQRYHERMGVYEQTPNVPRVSIPTNDPKALGDIYEFLRFQINEHQTGDSLALDK